MEKEIEYYQYAENDYEFLKRTVESHIFGNATTYIAHNVCEQYLKSVIDYAGMRLFCANNEMETHSIRKLGNFIQKYIPTFVCNWPVVAYVNDFYFTTKSPGKDSYFAGEVDFADSWNAVVEVKRAVDDFFKKYPRIINTPVISDATIEKLKQLDNINLTPDTHELKGFENENKR